MNPLSIVELVAGGIPQKIAEFLHQISSVEPKHWKGNHPPEKHHFESIDGFSCGAHLDTKTFWCTFTYTDNGVQHTLEMEVPVAELGKRGSHDAMKYDGQAVPLTPHPEFILSQRLVFDAHGMHHVAVCEFYFGTTHTRFDGDLPV